MERAINKAIEGEADLKGYRVRIRDPYSRLLHLELSLNRMITDGRTEGLTIVWPGI